MTDTHPPTYYLSRTIPVPPGLAREVFGSPDATRATRFRPTRTRSHRIVLELQPWSSSRTELGLRFAGRRPPPLRDLEKAGSLLDRLAADLELRCMLAVQPAHGVAESPVTAPEQREVASASL